MRAIRIRKLKWKPLSHFLPVIMIIQKIQHVLLDIKDIGITNKTLDHAGVVILSVSTFKYCTYI